MRDLHKMPQAEIWIVFAITALLNIDVSISIPSLYAYTISLGGDRTTYGLAASGSFVSAVIMLPIFGYLGDRCAPQPTVRHLISHPSSLKTRGLQTNPRPSFSRRSWQWGWVRPPPSEYWSQSQIRECIHSKGSHPKACLDNRQIIQRLSHSHTLQCCPGHRRLVVRLRRCLPTAVALRRIGGGTFRDRWHFWLARDWQRLHRHVLRALRAVHCIGS
eukprot:SAG11_NODE_3678_length_2292_cov_3.587779_3_plen_217_part_00